MIFLIIDSDLIQNPSLQNFDESKVAQFD